MGLTWSSLGMIIHSTAPAPGAGTCTIGANQAGNNNYFAATEVVLRKIARLPPADMLAIPLAWLLIGTSATLIRLVPFARFARLLGLSLGAVSYTPMIDENQLQRARFVRRAIGRAVMIAPFRADCFPQVMTAAVFCRLLRIPAASHFGVRLASPDNAAMSAHAWTVAGPIPICGGHGFRDYDVVSCFLLNQPH